MTKATVRSYPSVSICYHLLSFPLYFTHFTYFSPGTSYYFLFLFLLLFIPLIIHPSIYLSIVFACSEITRIVALAESPFFVSLYELSSYRDFLTLPAVAGGEGGGGGGGGGGVSTLWIWKSILKHSLSTHPVNPATTPGEWESERLDLCERVTHTHISTLFVPACLFLIHTYIPTTYIHAYMQTHISTLSVPAC